MRQTKKLDVFVSSDQSEFQRLRRQFRNTICDIQSLTCALMEDRGAAPSTALDASLKAVRETDIYVGVFGKDYSEITIKEYQEAVKNKKPAFIYIKKVNPRDAKLSDFIENTVKPSFLYFEFDKTSDAIRLLKDNLEDFLVETLRMGIESRSQKLGQTIAFMTREEKRALSYVSTQDSLIDAQRFFEEEKYEQSALTTIYVIEAILKKALASNEILFTKSMPFGEIARVAQKSLLLSSENTHDLNTLSILRSQIVHQTKKLERKDAQEILDLARPLLEAITSSRIREKKTVAEIWKPFPKINFNIAQKLVNITNRLLRVCDFPQVAWEAVNDSPYQLRVKIEVHPILGGHDLHPLKDDNINGKSVYEVEPNSYVFANGCFTLPKECADSKEDLVVEIRATVTDVNDIGKGELKLLPKRWKYVRETNSWFYYPQRERPSSEE